MIEILVLKRRLSALLPRDSKLHRRELRAPLGVSTLYLGLAKIDDDVGRQTTGREFAGFAIKGVFGRGSLHGSLSASRESEGED